ncbi:hypothetical protein NIA73_20210 [Anaerobutyricum hallii]|nr:hypothetical protein [Anaerobutyricum hallii]
MKKDNIKVTPEVLLLTAILGVPTGEVKKDGSRERFYPSSGPVGSKIDLVDECVSILKRGSAPVKKGKLKMSDIEEEEKVWHSAKNVLSFQMNQKKKSPERGFLFFEN